MEGIMSGKVGGPSKHALNRWVAALMPVIMMGLVGYATWVFVVLICIKHLLLHQNRNPPAIALIIVYFVLFLLFVAAYLRVLCTIYMDPGFCPKGPDVLQGIANEKIGDINDSDPEMGLGSVRRQEEPGNSGSEGTANSGNAVVDGTHNESLGSEDMPSRGATASDSLSQPHTLDLAFPSPATLPHPGRRISATPTSSALLPPLIHQDRPLSSSTLQGHSYDSYEQDTPQKRPEPESLSEWYNRDAFVCDKADGKPRWCWHCNSYKPDRSHHCGEVQRCVYKMDHFCPWVGGVVAETSYKFFYQVVVYGSFYCLFLIISVSVIVHEQIVDDRYINPNWLAALGLSCFFGLFSTGMAGSTTQLIYRNLSTIDSINHTSKVYQLAIYDPTPPVQPRPGHIQTHSPLVPRVWLPTDPKQGQRQRCFAIVKTQPGENPWRLEKTMDNFREVLGYSVWDWWLPIKQSPSVKKLSSEGFYRWNEGLLERLRKEAGIEIGRAT